MFSYYCLLLDVKTCFVALWDLFLAFLFSAYCVLGGLRSAIFTFLPLSPWQLMTQYICKPRGIKTHTKRQSLNEFWCKISHRYLSGVLCFCRITVVQKGWSINFSLTLSMKSTLWPCLFFVYTEENVKVSGRKKKIFMSVTTVEHYFVNLFEIL